MGAWSWTGELDAVLENVDEMTREIVSIMGESIDASPVQRPYGQAALAAYIEGRTYLEGWDVERNYLEAEDSFRRAIDEEERFAEAHAGLARALWTRYLQTRDTDLATEALSAAEKAVSLDETLPEAHLALGSFCWDKDVPPKPRPSSKKRRGWHPVTMSSADRSQAPTMRSGRNEAAEQMYQRAIDLRPGFLGKLQQQRDFPHEAG